MIKKSKLVLKTSLFVFAVAIILIVTPTVNAKTIFENQDVQKFQKTDIVKNGSIKTFNRIGEINHHLNSLRFPAELYFNHNNFSYEGFCKSDKVKEVEDKLGLKLNCVAKSREYRLSTNLPTKNTYYCVDTSSAKVVIGRPDKSSFSCLSEQAVKNSNRSTEITSYLNVLRSQAELHYNLNNFSYEGFCKSDNVKEVEKKLGSSKISCVAKNQEYRLNARLPTKNIYRCVDSTGFSADVTGLLDKSSFSCLSEQAVKNSANSFEKEPDLMGSLSIKKINATEMEFSGKLLPPKNCTGLEQTEFLLNFDNGESRTYNFKKCLPINYKEIVTYKPTSKPANPSLVLRWVDRKINTWQNKTQYQYFIDFKNPLDPVISDAIWSR